MWVPDSVAPAHMAFHGILQGPLWAGALPHFAAGWKLFRPFLAVLKPQLSLICPVKTYLIRWGGASTPSFPPFLTHYFVF